VNASKDEDQGSPSHRRISAVGLALLAALAAAIWLRPQWSRPLQSAWFDTYQIVKPRELVSRLVTVDQTVKELPSSPVTVVEIDDESLERIGLQWPWPRTLLAELVRDIERERPLAIGIDILMSEPDRLSPPRLPPRASQQDPRLVDRLNALPSNDRVLARAIADGPVVLGFAGTLRPTVREPLAPPFVIRGAARSGDTAMPVAGSLPRYAGARTNIDELDRVAAGHGLISVAPSDDVMRRIPLVAHIGDRPVLSLPLELLRVALGADDVRLYLDGESVDRIGIGNNLVIPSEPDGALRLYYSKQDLRRYVSAIDVLDGKIDPQQFEKKLVLIGFTALANTDYENTPLGVRMPGSEILAQVLENIYDQNWLMRPRWARALETSLFLLLGLSLVWATPRWSPQAAALLALGCLGFPIAAAFAAFLWRRWVFDAATPVLGLLVLFGVLLVLTLSETARQRRSLERIVQKQRERDAYIAGELEAAKRIQTGFLPRSNLLEDDRRVELAASITPAREVGGDLYDFFLLDRNRLFLMVGDVAGKGLSASMFMAVSKALYKSATLRRPSAPLGELMQAANEEVSRDNGEMFFVTVFAAVLDLESGDLTYCNAGHDNPYLLTLDGGGPERISDAAGPPLCAVEGFPYASRTRRLRSGELLCVVTDGVVEAQNSQREFYGNERLRMFLSRAQAVQSTAHSLVDELCSELRAFEAGAEQADDVTVLAARWIGPQADAGSAANAG
jgi:serine phosphatase RsbU (regulator of sigma subunit)/CHASE2 domain-containing sensor protein